MDKTGVKFWRWYAITVVLSFIIGAVIGMQTDSLLNGFLSYVAATMISSGILLHKFIDD